MQEVTGESCSSLHLQLLVEDVGHLSEQETIQCEMLFGSIMTLTHTGRDEKEKAFIYIEKSVRTKPRISASLQELYSVNILVFICFPRRANVTANNKKEKKKPN